MQIDAGTAKINANIEGPEGAPTIVLLHSLGTHLGLWDSLIRRMAQMRPAYRFVRHDLRGHGDSSAPDAPYTLGRLVRDTENVMDKTGTGPAVIVGLSVGAQIAIALAAKRPELVRGLVLANSAVKIATPQIWATRAKSVLEDGTSSIAAETLERWFSTDFRDSTVALRWRTALEQTPDCGYAGVASALGGADLISVASTLAVPTCVIAGSQDRATPPDVVREMADLIPSAEFNLIHGAGHLSPVDRADEFSLILRHFLERLDDPDQNTQVHLRD